MTVTVLSAPNAMFDIRNFANLLNTLQTQTYSTWWLSFCYSKSLATYRLIPSLTDWPLHLWNLIVVLSWLKVLVPISLYRLVIHYLIVVDLVMRRVHFESPTKKKIQ